MSAGGNTSDTATPLDATALALRLLDDAHVVCMPGGMFGRSAEGFLRLSYGAISLEELREALDRLSSWFASSRLLAK